MSKLAKGKSDTKALMMLILIDCKLFSQFLCHRKKLKIQLTFSVHLNNLVTLGLQLCHSSLVALQ